MHPVQAVYVTDGNNRCTVDLSFIQQLFRLPHPVEEGVSGKEAKAGLHGDSILYKCIVVVKGSVSYNKCMENEEIVNYIAIDQDIRFGKPCIKGTRITVGDILQWLSEGIPVAEILDDYPPLEEIHIKAALAYAAKR